MRLRRWSRDARLAHTEPEGYVGDESGQGLVPVTSSDTNLGRIDLPSSPDFAIDHRLLAPPEGGRLGDCDKPLGLDRQDLEHVSALGV